MIGGEEEIGELDIGVLVDVLGLVTRIVGWAELLGCM